MKLLFVSHWANNMLIFRTWMLQEAVRRGHEVLVLCPPDKEASRFANLGVRHVPWKLKRGGGVVNLVSAVVDAAKVLRRERPDSTVVYCVQPILAFLCAWKLGAGYGRIYPTFTGLGSLWTDVDPPGWKKRLVRSIVERTFGYLLPQAEKVFVLNQDDKAQVASWNRDALDCKMVQTKGEGVDLEKFRPSTREEKIAARARWGFPDGVKVVGFVGRLIREKGAREFLELCRSMREREDVWFLVVGDPDPGNPTSLSPEEVAEMDAVPRLVRQSWLDDVRPAYAAMDVMVFLSYREGLPVSPQEAMAMGVPVVARDNVGVRELGGKGMRIIVFEEMKHILLQSVVNIGVARQMESVAILQSAFLSDIGA